MNVPGRGLIRAAAVERQEAPKFRSIPFMGEGEDDIPTFYAKPVMGKGPALKQAASPNQPPSPAAGLDLSYQDAASLLDAIKAALPGTEFMLSRAKGCADVSQDSVSKVKTLKERLTNFTGTARRDDKFYVTKEEFDLIDKLLACAIQAQRTPDQWAYVILGVTLAGTILVASL